MLTNGDQIGAYTVVRHLGNGTFGETYLARHDDLGDRVLKVSHAVGPDAMERFEREARVLKSVRDQRLVAVHGCFLSESGSPVLELEYVDGVSVKELIRQQALDVEDALAVAESVCKGLEALHSKNIIHRDIKPSNVLIPLDMVAQKKPNYTNAKIGDFGTVGLLERGEGEEYTTIGGILAGTPLYMAPEQMFGDRQTVAVDFYGLGILLYEMIYREIPLQGKGYGDTISVRIRGELRFPNAPYVNDRIRSLITHCLERDPKHRPASSSSLLAEFQKVKQNSGPAPLPPETAKLALSTVGTRRRSTLATLFVFLAIVGTGALISIYFFVPLADSPALFGGIVLGVGLISGGVIVGRLVSRLGRRKSSFTERAETLLLGIESRKQLSRSISLEVKELIERCRQVDERVLSMSIVGMIHEFEAADVSADRQNALINISSLLEKLMKRLAPWYVRHEKALAFAVSSVGVASGIVSILATVRKWLGG